MKELQLGISITLTIMLMVAMRSNILISAIMISFLTIEMIITSLLLGKRNSNVNYELGVEEI